MKVSPAASAKAARRRDIGSGSLSPPLPPPRRRLGSRRSRPLKPEPRILVVDDDPATATMLSRSRSRHGFRVVTAGAAAEAIESSSTTTSDAAILDLVMPGQDGTALAAALREKMPGLPIVLLTGYTHSPLLNSAERSGIAV